MRDFLIENQKVPVKEYMNEVTNQPFVSICIQTYNHVSFIKEALDSFLMQETKFKFEILLGEDESDDGTREICLEYAKKNPTKIRLFLHRRENNIIINGRPTGRYNMLYNLEKAKGKYIALCEGDDYWTDPLKLQKQVDFLESNPNYGLSFTNGFIKKTLDGSKSLFYKKNLVNDISFNDILLGKKSILTASVCFRSSLLKNIDLVEFNSKGFQMADAFIWLELAFVSKIKYIHSPMIVHRHLEESVSKSKDLRKILLFSKSGYELEKWIADKHQLSDDIKNKITERRNRGFLVIAFKALLKDEAIQAYHKIKHKSFSDIIMYYGMNNKVLYFISKKTIKIVNVIRTFKKDFNK